MQEQSIKPSKARIQGYGPVAAIVVTLLAYFAAQFSIWILVSVIAGLAGWDDWHLRAWLKQPVLQFGVIVGSQAVMLGLIWAFLRSRSVSFKSIGLVRPRMRDVLYIVVGYATYFLLFISISATARLLLPGLDMDQKQDIGFSTTIDGANLWYVFISLVILPPLAEEIVMRGFLYTGLKSKLSFLHATLITSVLFALAHLQWGSGNALLWVAALDTFVLSLILVYLRQLTGSLWAPIGIHMLKNGLAFSLLFIFKVA